MGEKCIKKNETYHWTLKAPGGVPVPRPPSAMWTFWCKTQKFNSPLKKNSTQAQLWQELVSSKASFRLKIRAHTLMQDTTSSFKQIKISTQALLRPNHEALQASYRLEF
jgi:hypothetical protein